MNKIKHNLKISLICLLLAPVLISCGGSGSSSSSSVASPGPSTDESSSSSASKALKAIISAKNATIADGGSYTESGVSISCDHTVVLNDYSVQGRDKICINLNQVEQNPEEKEIIQIVEGDVIGGIDLSNNPAEITINSFEKAIKALKNQVKHYNCDIIQPMAGNIVVTCKGENLSSSAIFVEYNEATARFTKKDGQFIAKLFATVSANATVTIISKSDLGGVPPVNNDNTQETNNEPKPPVLVALNSNSFSFAVNSKISPLSFVNTGGAIKTCTVDSLLPTGLILNLTTCSITGTPTISKGSEQYNITANNSDGDSTVSINLEVKDDTVSADIESSLESAIEAVWAGSSLKKGGEYINKSSEIQKCSYTVVVTVIDQGSQAKEKICLELRKVQKNPEEDKFQYYGSSEGDNGSGIFVAHIDLLENLSENQGNVTTTLRNAKNALADQIKVYGACQVLNENIAQEVATIRCQGEHLKDSYISYKGSKKPLIDQKTIDHSFEADLEDIITDSNSDSAKSDEFFGMVRMRLAGDSDWHVVSATEGTVAVENDNSAYSKLKNSAFDLTVNKGGRIKLDLLRTKSVNQIGNDSLSVEEITVDPKKGVIIVESGVYYYKPNEDQDSSYSDELRYSAKSKNSGELSYAIASLNVNTNIISPPDGSGGSDEAPILKYKCRVGWFGTDQDLRLNLSTSAVFRPGYTIQIKAVSPVEFRKGTVAISVDHKFIAFKFGYATGVATSFNYTLKYANFDVASEVGTVLAVSSLYRDEFKDKIDYNNCKINVRGARYPKEEPKAPIDIK